MNTTFDTVFSHPIPAVIREDPRHFPPYLTLWELILRSNFTKDFLNKKMAEDGTEEAAIDLIQYLIDSNNVCVINPEDGCVIWALDTITGKEWQEGPKMAAVKEIKMWSAASVRQACIDCDLYTNGDNEEYEAMLSLVSRLYPDTESIRRIAADIVEHSEDQTVSNVMSILANEAVSTIYEIEGEED